MKLFWLSPADGQAWLSPQQVVERWSEAFARVTADADAARPLGERFLARYRALLAAGQGHNPTPLEVVERQWAGALVVEVWIDAAAPPAFRVVVCTDHRLELQFGRGVPPRKRRGLATAAAKALGYRVETVDGD